MICSLPPYNLKHIYFLLYPLEQYRTRNKERYIPVILYASKNMNHN